MGYLSSLILSLNGEWIENFVSYRPSSKSRFIKRIDELFKLQQLDLSDEDLYDLAREQYPHGNIVHFVNDYHQFISNLAAYETYLRNKVSICSKENCIFMNSQNRYNGRRSARDCKHHLNINRMLDQMHILIHQYLDKTECKNNQNEMKNELEQEENRFVTTLPTVDKDSKYLEYENGVKFEYNKHDGNGFHGMLYMYSLFKHKDLMDEIVMEKHLSLLQFRNEIKKVKVNIQSSEGRKLLNGDSWITWEHMLSVMLYTNYDNLQNKFSQTFRQMSEDEALSRHSEFYYFGKFLSETVKYFGSKMTSGDIFYHGINRMALFESTSMKVECPTSMTTSEVVALNFATNNGTVIAIKKDCNKQIGDSYFNCELWSDFPNEHERLFMGMSSVFIVSILDVHKVIHYDVWMHTLRIFELMFTASNTKINASMSVLSKVFDLVTSEEKSYIPQYIVANCNFMRLKMYNIQIDHRIFKDDEKRKIYECLCFDEHGHVDFLSITKLFPCAKSIFVKNYDCCTQQFFEQTYHFLKRHNQKIVIKFIVSAENKQSLFALEDMYEKRHKQLGYYFTSRTCCQITTARISHDPIWWRDT